MKNSKPTDKELIEYCRSQNYCFTCLVYLAYGACPFYLRDYDSKEEKIDLMVALGLLCLIILFMYWGAFR